MDLSSKMLRSHHLYFIYFTAMYGEKTLRYEAAVVCRGRRYRVLVGAAPWLRCLAVLAAAFVSGVNVNLWKR